MSLDKNKLDIVREENGWIYARCPACAQRGEDQKKEHLVVFDTGAYHCIKYGDNEEHRKRIWQLAGLNSKGRGLPVTHPKPSTIRRLKPKSLPELPKLTRLQWIEARRLCLIRNWSLDAMEGLFELAERGLLCTAQLRDDETWHDAWVIKDSSLRCLQAKKLYGKNWVCGKVKSLYGSWGNWTIGAPNIGDRPIVILCEGMPDFVAVLCVAYLERIPLNKIAPVCIAGASHPIHPDALNYFAGKRVRIFCHPDDVGQKSAKQWAEQLFAVRAKVDRFTFKGIMRKNGVPVKDLADYLTLLDGECAGSTRVMRDLWHEVLSGVDN